MKDATKRSRVDTEDEEEEESRPSNSNKAEKQKRRRLRKRHSSCSPEEDVIDGFVIASYSTLHSLEVFSNWSFDSTRSAFRSAFVWRLCKQSSVRCDKLNIGGSYRSLILFPACASSSRGLPFPKLFKRSILNVKSLTRFPH